MIYFLERGWRKLWPFLSRNEWLIRLLRLTKAPADTEKSGLIILQIDGLSHGQLQQALAAGHMPFLKLLLARENYQMRDLYSGLPSSTPAVQGELFYGIKQCVPAFGFKFRDGTAEVAMLESATALQVEQRLATEGNPLLTGGSAYSNIFTGGAAEAHFCVSSVGWGHILQELNPLTIVLFILLNIYSFVRVLALMVAEFFIALFDFVRGTIRRDELLTELTFIPTRVAICILLRELVTIGVKLDAARGLPIIHANFLGYDEQSHRRGPGSAFAHWSLKGIDDAIGRIFRSARHSASRNYAIWIYSDHGQEPTQPYTQLFGGAVQSKIAEVFAAFDASMTQPVEAKKIHLQRGEQAQRGQLLGGKHLQKILPRPALVASAANRDSVLVVAKGPLGFVYAPRPLTDDEAHCLATAMIEQAHIPLVLKTQCGSSFQGRVTAWTAAGKHSLPEDRAIIFGATHPFLDAVTEDLMQLCQHANAGDFVIGGWLPQQAALSFGDEHGSHGGPGQQETHAFALLPQGVVFPQIHRNGGDKLDYLRPLDLHQAALHALERDTVSAKLEPPKNRAALGKSLRVMTYNVHGCRGMDGQVDTARIARVIAEFQPDIIALQELDVGRPRSNHEDQAHSIARLLAMTQHFHPVIQVQDEAYGNAILSHLPMRLIKANHYPARANERRGAEPRGALWVEVEFNGQKINVMNTHLGLTPGERRLQVAMLLSESWLGSCVGPVIMCGDFNAAPWQHVCRRLRTTLLDAQMQVLGHKPKNTFWGRLPVTRIDHIFVNDQWRVTSAAVVRNALSRVSSDHLPLYVDVELINC